MTEKEEIKEVPMDFISIRQEATNQVIASYPEISQLLAEQSKWAAIMEAKRLQLEIDDTTTEDDWQRFEIDCAIVDKRIQSQITKLLNPAVDEIIKQTFPELLTKVGNS